MTENTWQAKKQVTHITIPQKLADTDEHTAIVLLATHLKWECLSTDATKHLILVAGGAPAALLVAKGALVHPEDNSDVVAVHYLEYHHLAEYPRSLYVISETEVLDMLPQKPRFPAKELIEKFVVYAPLGDNKPTTVH